jgi:hypothetical protein
VLDEVVSACAALVALIRDKDEFFDYFRKLFAKRLLAKGKQFSESSERLLLERLRGKCGPNQVSQKCLFVVLFFLSFLSFFHPHHSHVS